MLAGPFNAVKPAVGSGGTKKLGVEGGSPQPGEGKEERWRERERDDAREAGTKEDSSKQQCLHSPAEENTFHDPKKPGHRCIRRLPSFSPFFFFFHRHAKYTLFCEDRWFNVWRSHPGNRKYCPSSVQSSRDNFTYKRNWDWKNLAWA